MSAPDSTSIRRMTDLLVYIRSGKPDLTNRQMAIVMVVCWTDGPHTVRKLAELLSVGKPVITRAVATLSGLGLIERRSDPDDRRSVLIVATDAGRAFLKALPHG